VEVRFLTLRSSGPETDLAIHSVYAGVTVRQAPTPFHSLLSPPQRLKLSLTSSGQQPKLARAHGKVLSWNSAAFEEEHW
jgi:hypothetical protein